MTEDDLKVLKRGTVPAILEWVGEDLGRASLAYEHEKEREFPRKSLLVVLDEVLHPQGVEEPRDQVELPRDNSDPSQSPLRNDPTPPYEQREGYSVVRTINRGKTFFVCGTCGYKMVNEERLKAHVERHVDASP